MDYKSGIPDSPAVRYGLSYKVIEFIQSDFLRSRLTFDMLLAVFLLKEYCRCVYPARIVRDLDAQILIDIIGFLSGNDTGLSNSSLVYGW